MDLWLEQAARVLATRGRQDRERGSLDSLVHGDALAEHAAEGLDPSLAFVVRLARALLGCGMPSNRVEEALFRLASALDLTIDAICMPTALVITLSPKGATDASEVRTRVVRVEPGGTDLEKLSALHDLVGRVEDRELTPGDAARRVDTILARPRRLRPTTNAVGFGLTSMVSAALLGGSAIDVPIAAALGVVVGILEAASQRIPTLARLLPSLAAFGVSFLASMLAWQGIPVHPSVLLLAAIIVLLPGFTITTAITELATVHIVSGTARLMAGMLTFLQLGFGVALGAKIAEILPQIPGPAPADPLPSWVVLVAPFFSALGYTILLRARSRDVVWVLVAVVVALAGSQLGARLLGAELGAFVGSLAVATASHVFARWRDRPASLMLVPGTLFLVPGSIGFLSISSLLQNDVVGAVATGFRMVLVATALAAGLLVATAAVPPRKAL